MTATSERSSTRPGVLAWAWPYLLAALLALPAGLNLLRAGFWESGDGMHHLHRIAALTAYLEQGVLFPRWFGEFSFGYGAPVFNFYSPLSYYLSQPFAWLGPLWAMKLSMLAGLIASSVLLYHFAQGHAGRWPALAGAAVYALAPYRFVDLYPRAALAEHMAFLWLPLILWAFDGLWEGARRRFFWQVAGWAGLLLTHSFTALMFAPFFGLYLLVQAWARREWRVLVRAVLPLGLAVLVTAFFWLPLGLEARYAGLGAAGVGEGYKNHLVPVLALIGPLLFDYSTGGGRPDYYFAFGLAPAVLGLIALPFLRRTRAGALAAFGVMAMVAALFMVSRASTPVWDVAAPVLANIQFPWRFLGIATLGAALAVTGAVAALPRTAWQVGAVFALTVLLYVTSAARLPFQPKALAGSDLTPEQLWAFDRDTGQAGTTWGGEFIPNGVTEQRWALGRGAENPVDAPALPPVQLEDIVRRDDALEFTATAPTAWTFRGHTFYFPGWQARVDGRPVPTGATGDLGLVTAEVPPGERSISVAFERTPVRTAARLLTLAGLGLWALFVTGHRRSGYGADRRIDGGSLAAAVPLVLMLAIVIGPLLVRPVPVRSVTAAFGDRAQLVGARFPPTARAGETLPVELLWLASRQVSTNDKAFVHLVDAGGAVVAQSDSDPGGGFTPTTRWQPGEIVEDRHRLRLPEGLPAGDYRVMAGLYQFEPFRNLLTEPANAEGRVLLGTLSVR